MQKLPQNGSKALNIRAKTIQLLGENIWINICKLLTESTNVGEKNCDPGFGNGFLDKTPKSQVAKNKLTTKTDKQLHQN